MTNLTENELTLHIHEDMLNREQFGYNKYKEFVHPSQNRDFLQEAYEELLDLAVYLKGDLLQTEGKLSVVSAWTEVMKDIPLEYNRKLMGGVELVYFKTLENIYNLKAIIHCRKLKKLKEGKNA